MHSGTACGDLGARAKPGAEMLAWTFFINPAGRFPAKGRAHPQISGGKQYEISNCGSAPNHGKDACR